MNEGLDKRFARHAAFGKSVRSAFTKIGLKIVAENGRGADTMTAAYYPPIIDDEAFRSKMATKYGVVVAGGLGHLKGKIFRVGHMGNVSSNDIMATIGAVEATLQDLGHSFAPGAGVGAAIESLKGSGY